MKKLIVSDLDGTIISTNLEKKFISYLLRKKKKWFPLICYNFCLHYAVKCFYKFFRKNISFKFFYYMLPIDELNDCVESWLHELKNSNSLIFNKNLLGNIGPRDQGVIVTNCPSFISKPFRREFLSENFSFIFGTRIAHNSIMKTYHYQLVKEIFGKEKMKILERIRQKSDLYTVGYGDSVHDYHFMEKCDERHIVTGEDFFSL